MLELGPVAGVLLHIEERALRLRVVGLELQRLAQERQRLRIAALGGEARGQVDQRLRRVRVEGERTLEAFARRAERAGAMLAYAQIEPELRHTRAERERTRVGAERGFEAMLQAQDVAEVGVTLGETGLMLHGFREAMRRLVEPAPRLQ